ncbi:hypothetical protein [Candidatus Hepatobacter penaei]|uniref:hypothetical protein n=1 Tax=Candidatus Hepatobacter penaei TaxID=1274402 RepID=UPI0004F2E524|nr:hypothetical protein [Candidatus Hepatobacter penaei]
MKLRVWMMVCAASVTVLSSKVWALPEKDISFEKDAPKVLTYDEGRKKGYQDGVGGATLKPATRGNKTALTHYNHGYKTGYRKGLDERRKTSSAQPMLSPAQPLLSPAQPLEVKKAKQALSPAQPLLSPAQPMLSPAQPVKKRKLPKKSY